MSKIKSIVLILAVLCISIIQVKATENPVKEKKTAESVLVLADSFDELTTENAKILKAEIKSLPVGERIKLAKMSIKQAKEGEKTGETVKAKAGLYVLAVVFPPLAVGIHTHWGMPTLWNVLWTMLFDFPGIIHAFIVLGR